MISSVIFCNLFQPFLLPLCLSELILIAISTHYFSEWFMKFSCSYLKPMFPILKFFFGLTNFHSKSNSIWILMLQIIVSISHLIYSLLQISYSHFSIDFTTISTRVLFDLFHFLFLRIVFVIFINCWSCLWSGIQMIRK